MRWGRQSRYPRLRRVSNQEQPGRRERKKHTMKPRFILVLALAASCYSPRPPEGAPCASSRECPSPQHCVLGSCSLRDAPPVDAAEPDAPDAPDIDAAAIDAAPDAPMLACTIAGLSCGGNATTFTCGGHCWVHCTGGATWTA